MITLNRIKSSTKSEKKIFPKLRKDLPIQIQETQRPLNRQDQKRNTPWHVILTTLSIHNEESVVKKTSREKTQVLFKGKPIRITTDSSKGTLKTGIAWSNTLQVQKDHDCQPRIL